MKTGIRLIGILLLAIAAFSCSRDDGIEIKPEPVQEQPLPEEPAPVTSVGGINPESGPKETIVTITGTHFGMDATKVKVFFNEEEANVQAVTDTQIVASVPIKAGTGLVKLVVDGTELIGPEFEYQFTATVSTFAGSDEGNEDGPRLDAKFNKPFDMAMDNNGNLYVADTFNHRIRKITPEGTVTTLAGSKKGAIDGALGVATFSFPKGVAVDEIGNVYVADSQNNKIRKITTFGAVITLAGSTEGYADGIGSNAQFNYPEDITLDSNGNVYVADSYNNKIRMITPDGTVSTVAGGDEGFEDGAAEAAKFYYPSDVALDADGTVYVADQDNHKIRKITPDGMVSTLAGSTEGYAEGIGVEAKFHDPIKLTRDSDGNIYVTDYYNNKIRKITSDGFVSTLAGGDEGNIDGEGADVQFDGVCGIVISSESIIYVTELGNNKIRKITQE